MDGNGRWATRRALPRAAGHRAGVEAVRQIAEIAPKLCVGKLTLFAFSSDNWRRPATEVNALLTLLQAFLRTEIKRLVESGTRLTVIGRRDRLPPPLRHQIAGVENATAAGRHLHLRIAFDYSSRDAISRAAANWSSASVQSCGAFGRLVSQMADDDTSAPEVDLLIRTGGEKRLSDFLLWENAYAELFFTDTMWPDFSPADLRAAILEFHQRERRFGGLGHTPPLAAVAAASA
jgi:undecaprenyl diphosphate synthase